MAGRVQLLSRVRCFHGVLSRYATTGADGVASTTFSVYVPPSRTTPRPRNLVEAPGILYWLPHAGSDDVDFFQSGGAMHLLTAHPFVTVSASARGEQGLVYAGRMHSWIVEQLPRILAEDLNIHAPKRGVFGAGAGGYGALLCGLRAPDLYDSVSAFGPICNPTATDNGVASLSRLTPAASFPEWDPVLLAAASGSRRNALVDVGLSDPLHHAGELRTEAFRGACKERADSLPATIRERPGYDGSHWFTSTYVHEHVRHHAAALK